MRLDVHEKVNVIVRTWPGASVVLRRHGVDDLLGWAGTPLDVACREHGIDVEVVAEEIVRQVDPDVSHAFRAKPNGTTRKATTGREAPAAAIPPRAPARATEAPVQRAATPPPLPPEIAEIDAPAQEEGALPDVSAVYRARPVFVPSGSDDGEPVELPPPAPVDDGMPDVARVFKVRAGTPEAPFLHAHRPAPVEEPAPPAAEEAPQQVDPPQQPIAAEAPPAPAPAAPTPPDTAAAPPSPSTAAEPPSPSTAALLARRKELQEELELLVELRERALSRLTEAEAKRREPEPAQVDAAAEAQPQEAHAGAPEESAPEETGEPARSDPPVAESGNGSQPESGNGSQAKDGEAQEVNGETWVSRMRSWFAA